MKHFVEIQLIPDPEVPAPVLMNAVFSKLHKVLCDLECKSIGVGFPRAGVTLCDVLRLFGGYESLVLLQQTGWLGAMADYSRIAAILPVPERVKHRTVSRKQRTMSESKLKRLLKRGSITEAEAKAYRAKMFTKGLDNPYVELVSASNGHRHRRYIEFGELQDSPVEGEFDNFGLSKTATVPWF